ncbi:ninja-family protein AFP3-like [Apium graveolens]|uniref:ninja-family protein AFP3-like n=1 Tax=Apium graveolens TaxID=4045 RepID=UPI003D7A4C04
MGDGNETKKTSKEMENLSLDNKIPRDFLQRFSGGSGKNESDIDIGVDASDNLELNLGLSLGGRFGVDRSTNSNKLVRSSSIAGAIPLVRDEPEVLTPPATAPAPYAGLVRTSSLPVETEDQWRKRKEMQSLRRMEAKRRRSEKQRVRGGEEERRESDVSLRGRGGQRQLYVEAMNKVGSSAAPQFGLPSWAVAAKQTILGGGIEGLIARGRGNSGGGSGQESTRGCSSTMSEMESSKALQGTPSCGDFSATSIQSARSNQDTAGSSGKKEGEISGKPPRADLENLNKRTNVASSGTKDSGMNSLDDMPCVFTKGDGPNGRRIEGILYKYGKGEEVRIMCVCHGDFYSPAGFVKHAGGTDIAHPLKHIVVNPSSS